MNSFLLVSNFFNKGLDISGTTQTGLSLSGLSLNLWWLISNGDIGEPGTRWLGPPSLNTKGDKEKVLGEWLEIVFIFVTVVES